MGVDADAEPAEGADKMVADPKYFTFGSEDEFLQGIATDGGLTRSMAQEFAENDGGKYKPEFDYVARHAAIAVPDEGSNGPGRARAQAKFQALSPALKAIRGRDGCFDGWTLEDFWKCVDAQAANLTRAEVCALRLYTGPAYRPINAALRNKNIAEWATTIACCFSGVLKLSMLRKNNKKERVYRGVQEEHLMLPSSFLDGEDGALAGGVECARLRFDERRVPLRRVHACLIPIDLPSALANQPVERPIHSP